MALTEKEGSLEAASEARDESFLEISSLGKSFVRGRGRRQQTMKVLDRVDLTARRNEFVTVIGPSGCGKSTLLNCIAGLTPYDSGRLAVGGREIHGPGPDRAVVFQNASLLPWRTIRRNVAYGLELRRELRRSQISERVDEVLRLVGLDGFASHYPHEVSGGMQQRANLARALAVDSELMLMDEPFGALDALTKERLQDELASLATQMERTTVFITHDIREAVFLGDTVHVMSGRPGTIELTIPIPFPRPRPREITTTPEFEAIVTELRGRLFGEMDELAQSGLAAPHEPTEEV